MGTALSSDFSITIDINYNFRSSTVLTLFIKITSSGERRGPQKSAITLRTYECRTEFPSKKKTKLVRDF